MHRIPFQDPTIGLGVLDEVRPVPHLDSLQRRQSRANQLAASRKARHQVWLDQSSRDLQVRLDVTRVDPDRHATSRLAQVRVLVTNRPVMVFNPVLGRNPLAHQLDQLVTLVRPVHPGRDQDQDLVPRNPGCLQCRQQAFQDHLVGHRAGDVANGDAGRRPTASQLRQPSTPGRIGNLFGNSCNRVRQHSQRLDRQGPDDVRFGQFHRQAGLAVIQSDLHGRMIHRNRNSLVDLR